MESKCGRLKSIWNNLRGTNTITVVMAWSAVCLHVWNKCNTREYELTGEIYSHTLSCGEAFLGISATLIRGMPTIKRSLIACVYLPFSVSLYTTLLLCTLGRCKGTHQTRSIDECLQQHSVHGTFARRVDSYQFTYVYCQRTCHC